MSASNRFVWYCFAVTGLSLVATLLLWPFLGVAALRALCGIGLIVPGLWLLRGSDSEPAADERDLEIYHRALTAGLAGALLFLFAACGVAVACWGSQGLVPMSFVLPSVALACAVFLVISMSVGLFDYWRGQYVGE